MSSFDIDRHIAAQHDRNSRHDDGKAEIAVPAAQHTHTCMFFFLCTDISQIFLAIFGLVYVDQESTIDLGKKSG
jgi:hypothetical protein